MAYKKALYLGLLVNCVTLQASHEMSRKLKSLHRADNHKFIEAAKNNDLDDMQLYLIRGADPNTHWGQAGTTALIHATKHRAVAIVELLMRQPTIDVDKPDKHNHTASYYQKIGLNRSKTFTENHIYKDIGKALQSKQEKKTD